MYAFPFRIHISQVCFFKESDSNHPVLKLKIKKGVKWESFSKYSIGKNPQKGNWDERFCFQLFMGKTKEKRNDENLL